MWTKIFEFAKETILLTREVQQNKTDIKDIRDEVKELRNQVQNLTLLVQRLSFEMQQISEREQSERREMALKLENEMLKFERRLPSGKDE